MFWFDPWSSMAAVDGSRLHLTWEQGEVGSFGVGGSSAVCSNNSHHYGLQLPHQGRPHAGGITRRSPLTPVSFITYVYNIT